MKQVNTHEAKTNFSRLLRRVAAGEEITISNRGVPIARLIPISPDQGSRKLGVFRDQMTIPDDFDAPLPEDILSSFEGKPRRARKKR
jgi:prevent-host-death family protein